MFGAAGKPLIQKIKSPKAKHLWLHQPKIFNHRAAKIGYNFNHALIKRCYNFDHEASQNGCDFNRGEIMKPLPDDYMDIEQKRQGQKAFLLRSLP